VAWNQDDSTPLCYLIDMGWDCTQFWATASGIRTFPYEWLWDLKTTQNYSYCTATASCILTY